MLFLDTNPEEDRDSGIHKASSRKTTKIEEIYPSCSFIVNRDIFLKIDLYYMETETPGDNEVKLR